MVRFRATHAVLLTFLLWAGCQSPARRTAQAPVWEDIATTVPASPQFPIAGPIDGGEPAKPTPPTPRILPPSKPTETWVALERWCRANTLCFATQLSGKPAPSYSLQSTNGALVLHTGSQLAQWEGTEVRLGFAPQLIDGRPYVHTLDLNKTILPLLQGEPGPLLRSSPVIVIDPGHGGENSGTRSVLGNRYEKDFTLDWAMRLQAALAANHCRVFLTRSNDTDLALSNRVAFAAEHNADLFISLHFNSAAPNEKEAGLETYCLTPAGMPSNLTRGYADELLQTFPNNAFDTQNLLLALKVHKALLQVNGHRDRGIRHARFPGVLRGQQRPAILVEGGYLSNPQEARQISDPSYRQRLAEAVARGVLSGTCGFGAVALNTSGPSPEPSRPAASTGNGSTEPGNTAAVAGEDRVEAAGRTQFDPAHQP
ncbi:MAG TPA: N-acetylmuramoyl-L-alanine amidase [Verrucomicrobiae bacterium]|nr:N-acetylmuramoyl-L-alanine amidase [Verrucomicrobiae bacterium]